MSRDAGIVDEILPARLYECVDVLMVNTSISIMIILLNIYFVFPLGILIILVLLFRELYLKTGIVCPFPLLLFQTRPKNDELLIFVFLIS